MFVLLRSFNIFLTLILRFPSGFSSLSEKNTFFFSLKRLGLKRIRIRVRIRICLTADADNQPRYLLPGVLVIVGILLRVEIVNPVVILVLKT